MRPLWPASLAESSCGHHHEYEFQVCSTDIGILALPKLPLLSCENDVAERDVGWTYSHCVIGACQRHGSGVCLGHPSLDGQLNMLLPRPKSIGGQLNRYSDL